MIGIYMSFLLLTIIRKLAKPCIERLIRGSLLENEVSIEVNVKVEESFSGFCRGSKG